MDASGERRSGDLEILQELRQVNRRLDTLNTRLFGNPEGEAGDEGRLVVVERRINSHAQRLAGLEKLGLEDHEARLVQVERFRWWVLGGLAAIGAGVGSLWHRFLGKG